MLDWLIVGGGIHGVHVAVRLLAEGVVTPAQLRIVDPAERLLALWRARTEATGMTHLRSTSVHHLDVSPASLRRFASRWHGGRTKPFIPPYDRPALALFDAHCDQVLETFGLSALHLRDRVVACRVEDDGVQIELSKGGPLETGQVVLAIGAGERPAWPEWGPRGDPRVDHVFRPGFEGWPDSPERVVVVGGGISAAQVALRLMAEGHRAHLVSRHPLREHQFDSDPGWLGPKLMAGFEKERDVDRRRAIIDSARHRGSVPPDVRKDVCAAIDEERLRWHEGDVVEMEATSRHLTLRLDTGAAVEADRVLLATGFSSMRPGGPMVDDLIASASLPCAECGYPIVDSALRWHPRVHVTGPLAELELGPASRNIAGARRAGDRLVAHAAESRRRTKRSSEARRDRRAAPRRVETTLPPPGRVRSPSASSPNSSDHPAAPS